MRIIGLYGHGNCGKSETQNELKEMLRAAGKSISTEPHPWSEKQETFEYKGLDPHKVGSVNAYVQVSKAVLC